MDEPPLTPPASSSSPETAHAPQPRRRKRRRRQPLTLSVERQRKSASNSASRERQRQRLTEEQDAAERRRHAEEKRSYRDRMPSVARQEIQQRDTHAHQVAYDQLTDSQRLATNARRRETRHSRHAVLVQQRQVRAQQLPRAGPRHMSAAIAIEDLDENDIEQHSLGEMDVVCSACGAFHFAAERTGTDTRITLCCNKGKVHIAPPRDVPAELEIYFSSKYRFSQVL